MVSGKTSLSEVVRVGRLDSRGIGVGIMRKLFVLILLAGAFFWGYQTGRRPGSPDLIPVAQDTYNQTADICKRVAAVGHEVASYLPAAKELALSQTDKNTAADPKKAPAK